MTASRPRVVILGGGFAGVATARQLSKLVADRELDAELVLVNRENYFVFQPLLTEILPGTIETTHVVVPLRRLVPRVDVEVARVTTVDVEHRQIVMRRRVDGASVEMGYDALVLALGSITDFRTVKGMAEYALPIRTLGDAFFLRNHALDMLEAADLEQSAARREKRLTFVVVGGGSTGVEVAAELHELLRVAASSFHETELRPRVVLVHSRKRLLPEFDASLGRYATRRVAKLGVELMLGHRLTEVREDCVVLDDGTTIPASTVVSTVGNAPHPVVSAIGGPHDDRGWLRPEPTFHVPQLGPVWALGDCASLPDLRTGRNLPATAQFAVREGPVAALNVVAALKGGEQKAFRYEQKGMLVSLGMFNAAGQIYGQHVSGLLGWLLWRGYYLSQLPSWDRRVRVTADWLLASVMPKDIVQLNVRRTRTVPVDDTSGAETGEERLAIVSG